MDFECCPGMRWFSRIALAVLLAAGLVWFLTVDSSAKDGPQAFTLREGSSETARFAVEQSQAYGLLISAPDISAFAEGDALKVTYRDPAGREITKQLHAGDGDLYATVRPEQAGTATVTLEGARVGEGRSIEVEAQLTAISVGPGSAAGLGVATHTGWKDAQPITLGSTIYASADDRPYVPSLSTAREQFAQMLAGIHWYKFDYAGPGEKLVHLNVEMLDRDVPVDVALFTVKDGEPVEYKRGTERYEPEKSTILHGLHKFQPRVIAPGTYYVRVMGNHPAYQLQTELYDVPPYDDARKAVRTAMDYIVRKGDSWHANVPRKGVVALRTTNPVQETRLCIACHPTHFSTRSEMIAVENGYPVRARPSLQFLIERLSNNPRPLYGKTDASWARMIHAPGNVLTRLAYIVDKFDKQISGERREELYRGIREFMEMYWPGVTAPQPESNGNLPRISGYEVAHHSGVLFEHYYKATGEEKYKALREQTEQVTLAGEPVDMLDLSWQTVALVELGGEKYREKIDENVERIFSHQKKDGSWAMPFAMEIIEYNWSKHIVTREKIPPRPGEDGPPTSEFQTFHAIYALAKAGVGIDDPRLRKAVDFCLAQQTASGAWQGSPEYKNFDTPFRDTQYAIMALSQLFPGPKGAGGAKGWNAGFPEPPAKFDTRDVVATISALDQHWDRPADDTVAAIRELLDSGHVLVRFQAAVALGRFADTESIERLAERLGDRSKIVQRAAAWSLRQIGSRRLETREQFAAAVRRAMRSSDARTRWGAARIFNQHFKYISEEWKLGTELVRMAWHEPVPAVQMQALQGLYQWWFWDRDVEHKKEIEIALANGLGRENHPWVRRNFIEAYYNTLDDNLRYLYGSWMERVKRDDDRAVIGEAHKVNVREQAARYRDAMLKGNERARDGLLRVFFTHVLREGLGDVDSLAGAPLPETVAGPWVNGYKWFAIHDPLKGGTGARAKTGNDSDPPTFYEDSSPLMNEALLATLSAETPELADATLRAMRFLNPFRIEVNLAERMLELASKPSPIRGAIVKEAKSLLPSAALDDPKIIARLGGMLREGDAVSVEVASAILTQEKQKSLAGNAELRSAVTAAFGKVSAMDERFAPLVDVLAVMPELHGSEAILEKVAAGFGGGNDSRAASLRFALGAPETMKADAMRRAYDRRFAEAPVEELVAAIELVGRLNYKGGRYDASLKEIRELVLQGMKHESPKVRAATLTSVRTVEPLQADEEVRGRLQKLLSDENLEVRNSALAFKASLDARAGREGYDTNQLLDYEYFKVHVQPILVTKGADGLACANCHANHTIFKLVEPDEFGVLDEGQIRSNYASAVGVVNVANPADSLLLNKPSSNEDAAGIGNSQRFSHGGDLRWPQRANSREYRTILRWIQGERLGSAQPAGGE